MINNRITPPTGMILTDHAAERMAQRNLSEKDLAFVLEYGQHYNRSGAEIYFLGRSDLPKEKRRKSTFSRLEGTVVITARNQTPPCVITVYRNRKNGLKCVKQKPHYFGKFRAK